MVVSDKWTSSIPAVPPVGPGAIPFTQTPKAPHSSAKLLVRLSTAALAADACACQQERRSHHGAMHSN